MSIASSMARFVRDSRSFCDETLRPYDPAADVDVPVEEAFRDIENIGAADLPTARSGATFRQELTGI